MPLGHIYISYYNCSIASLNLFLFFFAHSHADECSLFLNICKHHQFEWFFPVFFNFVRLMPIWKINKYALDMLASYFSL